MRSFFFFFFFQAEDGIRDLTVTGVQTCALPIYFPAPEALKDAAARAIHDDVNQYAITWGAKRLRDALARKYAEWYGMTVDPEADVTVTCGATEAMASALLAVVDPGDEVLVLEPL